MFSVQGAFVSSCSIIWAAVQRFYPVTWTCSVCPGVTSQHCSHDPGAETFRQPLPHTCTLKCCVWAETGAALADRQLHVPTCMHASGCREQRPVLPVASAPVCAGVTFHRATSYQQCGDFRCCMAPLFQADWQRLPHCFDPLSTPEVCI